jgi:hypothetical protein
MKVHELVNLLCYENQMADVMVSKLDYSDMKPLEGIKGGAIVEDSFDGNLDLQFRKLLVLKHE